MRVQENSLRFGERSARELIDEFGSPLFVYEEDTLRARCRDLRGISSRTNFRINYSCKANGNVALLKIIREEGLSVDAMSPGEIVLGMEAGFGVDEILFIPNNVSADEMRFAAERGVKLSVDSLSQLETYCTLNPGGEVLVRVNPGIGDGHHKKVMTGGKAKFGITPEALPGAKEIAASAGVRIVGLNMHIGSFFLEPGNYLAAIETLLRVAEQFDSLTYLDFGGGIGIPYRKSEDQRFSMREFGSRLDAILDEWEHRTNRANVTYMIEPGRYPVAECGTILTTVHSIKENYGTTYVGTDLGFNLLARPMLYGAYHEIIVCENVHSSDMTPVSVCGNICESGDLLAEDRPLPEVRVGDTLAVLDAGAYGFAMSSNYNGRLRPAEVLLTSGGEARVIRERETLEYLLINQRY